MRAFAWYGRNPNRAPLGDQGTFLFFCFFRVGLIAVSAYQISTYSPHTRQKDLLSLQVEIFSLAIPI